MPDKIDFAITDCELDAEVCKTGVVVEVSLGGSSTHSFVCKTASGAIVGQVPSAVVHQLPTFRAVQGSIRSVKRDAVTKKCIEVTVRITLHRNRDEHQASQLHLQRDASTTDAELLDGGILLQRAELQRLVHHDALKPLLADGRLQAKIKDVDSADNREKALEQALAHTDFRNVANQLLAVVFPEA